MIYLSVYVQDINNMAEVKMILVRFFVPLIYSVMIGGAWSLWSRKKFSSSVAPAYMLHILVVLLSGLVFKRLTIGIYGGIFAALGLLVLYVVKDKKQYTTVRGRALEYLNELWNGGLFTFCVFYILCYFMNSQKCFEFWDEFSHWGMFLKESLRLDVLYCMSPLEFAHKDYVPAITLFETIWCKLNFRFAEPDAYRAIQIFMFSLLMPMFESFDAYSKKILFRLSPVAIVLLIPLIFNTANAFLFYHSIYCDVAVAIVFYWCMFEAYRKHDNLSYQCMVIAIGVSVLVLSKMIAMALLPLVVVFFVIRVYFFSDKKTKGKENILMLLPVVLPVGLWGWFNKFAGIYAGKIGGTQTYSGMQVSSLKDVFLHPDNGAIPYLGKVKFKFFEALLYRDILLHGSYCVAIIFMAIMFLVISFYTNDILKRRLMRLLGLWTLASGIFYAVLFYFLYATSFSEHEAVQLASYERYMNSFVIAALFLLIAVYYDSEIWKGCIKGYYRILIFLSVGLGFFHADAFDQILPGNISGDAAYVQEYTSSASFIMNNTGEDDRIFIIKRGDNGNYIWHERYYCSPRIIGGGSIGPAIDEEDIWSWDATTEELIYALRDYDYIYFSGLDEEFIKKYSEVFEDPSQIVEGKIYRISGIESKVTLVRL